MSKTENKLTNAVDESDRLGTGTSANAATFPDSISASSKTNRIRGAADEAAASLGP
jgi:hypothetical protein